MGMKVATTSFQWPHPSVSHSPSSSQAIASATSQTLASAMSSPASKRCSFVSSDGAMFCRYADRSALLGCHPSSKLYRSRTARPYLSASLASFSDEEFSKQIQELALRFQLSGDEHSNLTSFEAHKKETQVKNANKKAEILRSFDSTMDLPISPPEKDDIIPTNIERKANRFEIPVSLRMIKRKKQWQEGFKEAGESAVDKAFSSMVFIIQELHSYTLHMREVIFYEDLQGILARVQNEMNASFVWLFQQVFSHTPSLMVYVMILLANYSVYSMANSPAFAITSPVQASYEVSVTEVGQKFVSPIIRTLDLTSSNEKTTSISGNNGGGGKHKPVASGEDGDKRFNGTIVSNGLSSVRNSSGEKSISGQDEVKSWNLILEEASIMQNVSRDEALDQETRQKLVSPLNAKIETDDKTEYFRTELLYQTQLAQEPNNSLLLANYAQFLYLVTQDFDRAEDYFKRATAVEPKDAEALNKYANFLWLLRKDLWAAEETYQKAIDTEPSNSYYTANYAHFLWNTGGEDTCFV